MNGFEEVNTNEKFEDRELEWDDFVENDSPDFVLLPDGDYDFQVLDFERGRHPGSEKLPPCNKAIVHIKVEGPQGVAIIRHQLFLHTKTEGMLCAFFTGIGMRKKGEKVQMNWNAVVGAKGRAKIGIRVYKKDGEERKYNEIKKFYEPTDAPAPTINQQTTFEAGKF
ncbi:MAG: DUF669 domain-containing protein [Eubacteriales bacterium]|nr:DUF669 domain-containing protein [Eubacteriales bacterium]